MKKVLPCCLAGVMLLGCLAAGCSDKDKKEPAPAQKSAVRQMTDATARDAVDRIRTPIEKARSAAQQQEGMGRQMDDAANSR